MRTIDAHVHLWNLKTDPQPWIDPHTMRVLARSFGPDELDLVLDESRAEAGVVVQANNSAGETQRLLTLVHPRIAGVVGWVDMTTEVEPQLATLRQNHGKLVGLRHLVHLEADQNWLLRADVGRSFEFLADADLPFDLVLRPWQLSMALEVSRRYPDTRFVIDHLGGLAESTDDAMWSSDFARLGQGSNVFAKISGLASAAGGKDRMGWGVERALNAFDADRLMFGSDWPLAELGIGASAWRVVVEDAVSARSDQDQEQIFSRTAAAFYGLDS